MCRAGCNTSGLKSQCLWLTLTENAWHPHCLVFLGTSLHATGVIVCVCVCVCRPCWLCTSDVPWFNNKPTQRASAAQHRGLQLPLLHFTQFSVLQRRCDCGWDEHACAQIKRTLKDWTRIVHRVLIGRFQAPKVWQNVDFNCYVSSFLSLWSAHYTHYVSMHARLHRRFYSPMLAYSAPAHMLLCNFTFLWNEQLL